MLLGPLEIGLAPLALSTGLASARLTEQVQIIDRSMAANVQDLMKTPQAEDWLPPYVSPGLPPDPISLNLDATSSQPESAFA